MLYSIAFIMDPRAKIRGFNKALSLLSNLSGTNYSPYLTEVRAQLSTMFNKYDEKFGAVRTLRPSQPASSGKKKSAWGTIYGPDSDSDSGTTTFGLRSGNAPYTPSSLSRRTSASALLQAASTGAGLGIGSELNSYLDSDNVALFDDDFDIINWWHEHKRTYPVLSILAKDVLSVPAYHIFIVCF